MGSETERLLAGGGLRVLAGTEAQKKVNNHRLVLRFVPGEPDDIWERIVSACRADASYFLQRMITASMIYHGEDT